MQHVERFSMADQEYYVVFRGHLLPDWPREAVKGNLAKLFKADEARTTKRPACSGPLRRPLATCLPSSY